VENEISIYRLLTIAFVFDCRIGRNRHTLLDLHDPMARDRNLRCVQCGFVSPCAQSDEQVKVKKAHSIDWFDDLAPGPRASSNHAR
jgi:hypothetical protein